MLKIVFSLFITLNFVLAKTLSIADAFGLTTNADEQNIEFKFDLAEDIYVYKDSLKVKSNSEDITKFLNFPPSSNNGEHEIIMQKFSRKFYSNFRISRLCKRWHLLSATNS